MADYNTMLRTFLAELTTTEQFKRDMLIKLAKQLEKEQYPTNQINDKIAEDVEGYVSRNYVGQVLEDKYKDLSKSHATTRKKKKKQVIELAADGSVIQPPESKEDQVERFERTKFSEDLGRTLEARSKEVEGLDSMVMKELEQVRNEKQELGTKLSETINQLEKQLKQNDEVMELIAENLGFYMVFDKDEYQNIYVKEIDSEKANTRKELKIDLREFEDQIKNSFQKGKHVAKLKHNGEKVTSWN
jgi:NAD kinase